MEVPFDLAGRLRRMAGNMIDPYRLVIGRLHAAAAADAKARERIYAECRAHVAATCSAAGLGEGERGKALAALEKVIRRQEMQALYEESLNGG